MYHKYDVLSLRNMESRRFAVRRRLQTLSLCIRLKGGVQSFIDHGVRTLRNTHEDVVRSPKHCVSDFVPEWVWGNTALSVL